MSEKKGDECLCEQLEGMFKKFRVAKVRHCDLEEIEFHLIDPNDTVENAIQIKITKGMVNVVVPRQNMGMQCFIPNAPPLEVVRIFTEGRDLWPYFKEHSAFSIEAFAMAGYCAIKTVCAAWAASPQSHGCPVACQICEMCGGRKTRLVTAIYKDDLDDAIVCSPDEVMEIILGQKPEPQDEWKVRFVSMTGMQMRDFGVDQ
jgi:hypothetical protein